MKFTKEDVINNKKDSIKKINNLLEKYINETTGKYLKKANLISYWIKDYVRFINFEEQFNPKKNIAYKRGDIVKVAFGFNIGSEYGGLHYAIVLDNNNDHSSSTVTVIPLTSIKQHYIPRKHNVVLGNEIFKSLYIKCKGVIDIINKEQEALDREEQYLNTALNLADETIKELKFLPPSEENKQKIDDAEKILNESTTKIETLKCKLLELQNQQEELMNILNEISNMKQGSIALVGQITTISKIRIYDPKNSRDVLAGISLSSESMNKINEKMKELYIFGK